MPKVKSPRVKSEKVTKPVKKEPKYLVLLGFNDKVEELRGDDLATLFMDYEPEVFKSRVSITVEANDKKVERLWPVLKARRVFRNHNNATIEAGYFEKFLAE